MHLKHKDWTRVPYILDQIRGLLNECTDEELEYLYTKAKEKEKEKDAVE